MYSEHDTFIHLWFILSVFLIVQYVFLYPLSSHMKGIRQHVFFCAWLILETILYQFIE